MTISEADYLDIMDVILEAALDASSWRKVLLQLARLTHCVAGGVTLENPYTKRGKPIVYFGFDENHVEKTFAHFLPMNPLFKIAPSMKSGFIVSNSEVIPQGDFVRTDFYNGWARPQNLCCPVTLVLDHGDSFYCPLTLVRPDGVGDVTDERRRLLKKLAPQLSRAMRVTLQLEGARANCAAAENVLRQISVAVLLLDRDGRIVFANTVAEQLLATGDAIASLRGVLFAQAPESNRALQKAVQEIAGRKIGAGAEIAIEQPNCRPLLATVTPLACDSPLLPLANGVATSAVFIAAPRLEQKLNNSGFARNFGLTRAEARVLDAMISGAGIPSVAEKMSISLATARTHAGRIFSKTGTSRQGELIHLVMSSTPPLLPRD
jgi:DNA-binding CsgD family transcriptional regulator